MSLESKAGSGRRLAYSNRLHHRREFLEFFSGSQVYRLRHCSVFRKANPLGHFRLGVTFKAKMSSVERNALRRRIRETIRILGPALGSFDYNIVVMKLQRPALLFGRELAREIQDGLLTQEPAESKAWRKK
ncbi:MAG: ribonuclease P protein component [Oligoflexia bacterium]